MTSFFAFARYPKTVCDEEGRGLILEPMAYSGILSDSGISISQFNRYITPSPPIGLVTEPNFLVGSLSKNSISYGFGNGKLTPQPCASFARVLDGAFTLGEWENSTPAIGRYSNLYAKYCDGVLHVLNDWVLGSSEPDSKSCYNLFDLYTGNGRQHWAIYVYQEKAKGVRVMLNGKDVSSDSTVVMGGAYGWESSPLVSTKHTIYEFALKADEGGFNMQMCDPGPSSVCSVVNDVKEYDNNTALQMSVVYKSNVPHLSLELPIAQTVSVAIVDVRGTTIASFEHLLPAGTSLLSLQTSALPLGCYFVCVTASAFKNCRSIVVLR